MISSDKSGVSYFVQRCVDNGLRNVVCSPGSRNAPLVIGFDNNPEVKTFVIHDERSAAFYALGLSIARNEPVAVLCTSGSAMLNYYPAVAEAYYQCIPLVVISADRPEEWVNHGDGQTIVQKGVYDNHIKAFATIEEQVSDVDAFKLTIDNAFDAGLDGWRGPIHFNVPLTEPLYGTVEIELNSDRRTLPRKNVVLEESIAKQLEADWKQYAKKMVLCGQLPKSALLNSKLAELANDPSVVVLVENTSNLYDVKFVHCIDRTLATISTEELADFEPEILITLGGAVISKRIKAFLRNANIQEHWRVGYAFPEMDTYRALTKSLAIDDSVFVSRLSEFNADTLPSNYGSKWRQKDLQVRDKVSELMDTSPFSDLKVVDAILNALPENAILHMANSSVVRYCQLFDPAKDITYHSNRGTSGIDGSTSTAAGIAHETDVTNVLITGDVSFFYDSNALWNKYLSKNFKIVLINNEGGGIFRIIDGPARSEQLEEFFEAQHKHSAEHICKAFNVDYRHAEDMVSFNASLDWLINSKHVALLEVNTPTEINPKVLAEFFSALRTS